MAMPELARSWSSGKQASESEPSKTSLKEHADGRTETAGSRDSERVQEPRNGEIRPHLAKDSGVSWLHPHRQDQAGQGRRRARIWSQAVEGAGERPAPTRAAQAPLPALGDF